MKGSRELRETKSLASSKSRKEGNFHRLLPVDLTDRTDEATILQGLVIAAHQKMLAIVEDVAGLLINVRAGPSAGLTAGVKDRDMSVLSGQTIEVDRGGQTRDTSSDNGDALGHPW